MDIRPLTFEDSDQWAGLLATAFDRTPEDMRSLLNWLHTGYGMLAWGAWDGDVLTAQYSCLTMTLSLPQMDRIAVVGMSVNMATHPHYRGLGLIKQVAHPVYDALAERGVMAGVGFSNTAGVRVDRHSKGYGYQVIGKLDSVLVRLPCLTYPSLKILEHWSPEQVVPVAFTNGHIHFEMSAQTLHHRFVCHPFRNYQFAGWWEDEMLRGLVVFRVTHIAGYVPVASLLAVYTDNLPELLQRWVATMRRQGIHIAHILATPESTVYRALRDIAQPLRLPYSRNPYYLTAKPLGDMTPQILFDWMQWDSMGGDIL